MSAVRKLAKTPPQKATPKLFHDLGNTADGVLIVDGKQKIVYWNEGAQELLGYSRAEVSNQYCFKVITGRKFEKLWCHANCNVCKRVSQNTLPANFDLLVRAKNGKDIWVNLSTLVIPRKRSFLIVHLLRNATQQKKNEETINKVLGTLGVVGVPASAITLENGSVPKIASSENNLFTLTRREIEALTLLGDGFSTIEVAQQMGVSVYTVRSHIRNSLKKLGMHSKTQAVSFVLTNQKR